MMMSGINLANFVIVISAFIISALGLMFVIFFAGHFVMAAFPFWPYSFCW